MAKTPHELKFDELIKKLRDAITSRHQNPKKVELTPLKKRNEYLEKIYNLRDKFSESKKPKETSLRDVLKNNENIENKEDLLKLLKDLHGQYKPKKSQDEAGKNFNIMDVDEKLDQYRGKYKGGNANFGKNISNRLKEEAKEIELPLERLSKDFNKKDKVVSNNYINLLEDIERNKNKRTNVKEGSLETLAKKRQEYIENTKNLKDTAEKEQFNLENAAEDFARELLGKAESFDKNVLKDANASEDQIAAWDYLKDELESGLKKINDIPKEYRKFLGEKAEKKTGEQKYKTMAEFNKDVLTQPIPGTFPNNHTLLSHLLRKEDDSRYKDYDSFMKIEGNHPSMNLLTYWEKYGASKQADWPVRYFKDPVTGEDKEGKSEFQPEDVFNSKLYEKYLKEKEEEEKKKIKDTEERPLKKDVLNKIQDFKKTNGSKENIIKDIGNDFDASKSIYEKRFNKQLGNDLQKLKMGFIGKSGGLKGSRYEKEKEKIIENAYSKFQNDMQNLFLKNSENNLNDYKDNKVSLLEDINQKSNRYHNKKSDKLANNLINFSLNYQRKNENLKKKQDLLKGNILGYRQNFPHLRNQSVNELTSIDPAFSKDVFNEAMAILNTLGHGNLPERDRRIVAADMQRQVRGGAPLDSTTAKRGLKNYLGS